MAMKPPAKEFSMDVKVKFKEPVTRTEARRWLQDALDRGAKRNLLSAKVQRDANTE
jgi:hypothetical protein